MITEENGRYYIDRGGKRLRCGYTTGSCAAAASKAALLTLLGGKPVQSVWLLTPKGLSFTIPVEDFWISENAVRCAVRKDSGDDPDVTSGMLVYAEVRLFPEKPLGVTIEGGQGVGRVTKPGLDQPVGEAAINSTPRRMIRDELLATAEEYGYGGGISVTISIPEGERLAANTYNPRLGIVGGLSVLGTTGVVEPMSDAALVDTIRAELSMLSAANRKNVLLTPGNYGEEYIRQQYDRGLLPNPDDAVKTSNFIGDALEQAVEYGFEGALLVGHIGKLVKLAGGLYNTHSRYGDCRAEIFAAHAGVAGASVKLIGRIMQSTMTDDMLDMLAEAGLRDAVMATVMERIAFYLHAKTRGAIACEAIVFSNRHGFLGATAGAYDLAQRLEETRKG